MVQILGTSGCTLPKSPESTINFRHYFKKTWGQSVQISSEVKGKSFTIHWIVYLII
jgi:hypothetical protein